MNVTQLTFRALLIGLLGLLCTGCIPALPLRHLSIVAQSHGSGDTVLVGAEEAAGSLDELLNVAMRHHPDLRAAQARVEAARGRMIQAGLHPNPSFGPHFSQLGHGDNRLGEAGARWTQTIVTNNKLGLAKAAAAAGVLAADWQAVTKWHDVLARIRSAYFELLTALREQDTTRDIVRASSNAHDTARSLEKAGAGNRPDVLRASVELEQNRLKEDVSRRRVEAARQNLLTALGRPDGVAERLPTNRKELERTPPDYDWHQMLHCLRDGSAELHEARALVAQQEKLVAKAKADARPNIDVTAIPFYASYAKEMRAGAIVTAPIPLFDRNQGNIHAAKSELAFAWAAEAQLELKLTERLTGAYQRYQIARHQAQAYRDIILPKARESLKLIEAGYKGGDRKYDYTAVLQAQQVLFQAQLAETQALGELWRGVVEIAWILQQENLHVGCATRSHIQ